MVINYPSPYLKLLNDVTQIYTQIKYFLLQTLATLAVSVATADR